MRRGLAEESVAGSIAYTSREASPAAIEPSGHGSATEVVKALQQGEMRLLSPLVADDLIDRPTDGAKPFAHHPVAPEIMAEFAGIDRWLKHEQWFRSRGIPWRMGFLLYSEPGCGKDTIIRNLAIQHDLPIYAFDLSSHDNRSFVANWRTVMQNAPAIALLSDIDAVFEHRENVAVRGKQREGLTFDCLLDTISGIATSDGVLLFLTTNRLETLDPAIGVPVGPDSSQTTRPGRIDKAIRIPRMQERERRLLAEHILDSFPELIPEVVLAGEGETAAQFQQRCAQLALTRFWEREGRATP